jgi:hypothetical protein
VKNKDDLVGFEVLTVLKMSMLVLWVVAPWGFVGGYQHFGGAYRLHLQDLSPLQSSKTGYSDIILASF